MKEENKTKKQLIAEVIRLRQRITELELLEIERRNTEKSLTKSEEKYRSLVESTEDSIYLVDINCRYLFMNKKHISRLNLSGDEYLCRSYGEFHSPNQTKWFTEKVSEVLKTGSSSQHEHKSFRDGRYFFLTFSPVKKADGKIEAITIVSKDISERKSMEEKLQTLSHTDELTGLYNRRGFFTLAEQQLNLAKRMKKGIFMLYADLDDLKKINDKCGHQEGDLALTKTADILKKTFRESDIIARVGGDEFVVIPVGIIGDYIEDVSKRLQKNLDIYNAGEKRAYKLSLSVGIAYFDPENPCSVDELLVQGDKLMYEQKKRKQES